MLNLCAKAISQQMRGVMVKAMDCGIVVVSSYSSRAITFTFGKGMKPLILPAMGYMEPLLFFKENSFSIE